MTIKSEKIFHSISSINLAKNKNRKEGNCPVRDFADSELNLMIENNEFDLDLYSASRILDALLASHCDSDKKNSLIDFSSSRLEKIARDGFSYINEKVVNPLERALVTFIYLASEDIFSSDGSEKKLDLHFAELMTNGVLLANAYLPVRLNEYDVTKIEIEAMRQRELEETQKQNEESEVNFYKEIGTIFTKALFNVNFNNNINSLNRSV